MLIIKNNNLIMEVLGDKHGFYNYEKNICASVT